MSLDSRELEIDEYNKDLQAYFDMEGSKLVNKEDFDNLTKDLDHYEENKKA